MTPCCPNCGDPLPPMLIRLKSAGALVDLSTTAMQVLVDDGELPALRIGKRALRVRLSDVLALGTTVTPGNRAASLRYSADTP